jgi:toxin-antitoxin system PIN domain toxin
MALRDVNALVALAWDSHVHHTAIRAWFAAYASGGWATCALTESGFVRVSSNPWALPSVTAPEAARAVLRALRQAGAHQFLPNNISFADDDLPPIAGHRQVTDVQLLTLVRRNGMRLVTFDAGLMPIADGRDVELLAA